MIKVENAQLEAASRLHLQLKGWKSSDKALERLAREFPRWDPESSLIKCVAVNGLYGTRVYTIVAMAERVGSIMQKPRSEFDIDLVTDIARPPPEQDGKQFVSFASKLCHFFCDSEKFPIYDSAARKALEYHQGERFPEGPICYKRYSDQFFELKRLCESSINVRDLDRYLWIFGLYGKYYGLSFLKPGRTKGEGEDVNGEVMKLFHSAASEDIANIRELVPPKFYQQRR